jgi:hypothetical protein
VPSNHGPPTWSSHMDHCHPARSCCGTSPPVLNDVLLWFHGFFHPLLSRISPHRLEEVRGQQRSLHWARPFLVASHLLHLPSWTPSPSGQDPPSLSLSGFASLGAQSFWGSFPVAYLDISTAPLYQTWKTVGMGCHHSLN